MDYDSDGDLDLYICRAAASPTDLHPNVLHRNNGDGTFTQILTCRLSTDTRRVWGAAWGDYDNNGFPDVYVCNFETSYPNALYRNEGNGNNWLVFKLVGTASNRSAIGAKVRVEAVLGGKTVWQRRDISGGGGYGQNDPRAHFGLRDATEVKTVRIEWPSGIVQDFHSSTWAGDTDWGLIGWPAGVATNLHKFPANHFYTITEPRIWMTMQHPDVVQIQGRKRDICVVKSSSDLTNWTTLGMVTNSTGRAVFVDPEGGQSRKCFFKTELFD